MATTAVSRITCANAETYECSKHSGGMESLICFFVGSRSFGKTAATKVACSAVMSGLPQRLGRDEVRKSSCFGGCWPPLPIFAGCTVYTAVWGGCAVCTAAWGGNSPEDAWSLLGRLKPQQMLARSRKPQCTC